MTKRKTRLNLELYRFCAFRIKKQKLKRSNMSALTIKKMALIPRAQKLKYVSFELFWFNALKIKEIVTHKMLKFESIEQ